MSNTTLRRFNFYFMNANGITYSCMCNNEIKKETAFYFLEDLKNFFDEYFKPEQVSKAGAFSLNEQFREQIRIKMV